MKIKIALTALVVAAGMLVAPMAVSAAGPIKVMPLGDSITRGQGDGGTTGTYNGYRCSLKNRLTQGGWQIDYVGPLSEGRDGCTDSQHAGWSGWTIGELKASAAGWVTTYQPDVVLLMAGTNDVIERLDMGNMAVRLGQLIDVIEAARPGVVVIVSTIPEIGSSKWCCDAAQTAAWNAYQTALPGVAMARGARIAWNDGIAKADLNTDAIHPRGCAYGSEMPFIWYFAWVQTFPRDRTADPLWPPVGCAPAKK